MKDYDKQFALKTWYIDFFCAAIILGLNPIAYFLSFSPMLFTSDTISYATMARDLFQKGLLYIPSWGHLDHGLILPPLYPFLIACGQLFSAEILNMAEFVSSLCALMALVPIYLYLKEVTNRAFAIITAILIQINYYYFLIGMRPLSEATFLLTLTCTLFVALKFFKDMKGSGRGLAFLVGMLSGLVFLSRQIGIIIFVFLVILCLLHMLTCGRNERAVIMQKSLFVLLGGLVVFAPYTSVIFLQTGHHPLTQDFKRGEYSIAVVDPEILGQIKEREPVPSSLLGKLERRPNNDYANIYARRRLVRKLLPDASEMFAYLGSGQEEGPLLNIFSIFNNPKDYFVRLCNNIKFLKAPLGDIPFYLFLVFSITPLFLDSGRFKKQNRLILPCVVIFYIMFISCFTDSVSRYIYVIFPFVLIHISSELFFCFRVFKSTVKTKALDLIFVGVAFFLILLFMPRFFVDLKIVPKMQEAKAEFRKFSGQINGEPVFCLSPFYVFLAGGSYRILPNDTLEKVVQYGKKTRVHWLLIAWTDSAKDESQFYTNAKWYWNDSLARDYPDLVRFMLSSYDNRFVLYQIL